MMVSKELPDGPPKSFKRPEVLLCHAALMKELRFLADGSDAGCRVDGISGLSSGQRYPPHQTNCRIGISAMHIDYENGGVPISVPRDRQGSVELEPVKKGRARINGMDARFISLDAAGMILR